MVTLSVLGLSGVAGHVAWGLFLYIALRRRFGIKIHNNGHLYLSYRAAAKEIGSHPAKSQDGTRSFNITDLSC